MPSPQDDPYEPTYSGKEVAHALEMDPRLLRNWTKMQVAWPIEEAVGKGREYRYGLSEVVRLAVLVRLKRLIPDCRFGKFTCRLLGPGWDEDAPWADELVGLRIDWRGLRHQVKARLNDARSAH